MTVGAQAVGVPDLTGRTAIVTGASGGIGLQTALGVARHGARTILAGRDPASGRRAVAAVAAATGSADVEWATFDLADLRSVRRFAASFDATSGGLDILVNNAGVMALPRQVTVDGFERQFGTNHLGHFALTGLLLPALLARPGARVVTVSSSLYRSGRLDFDDLMGERAYSQLRAYSQSKLANVLFAVELQRRATAAGVALTSVAVHPGVARTGLAHTGSRTRALLLRLMRLTAQTPAQAARSSLYAATAADVRGGELIGPDGPGERSGHPTYLQLSARAADPATAHRLWTVSAELTAVRYTALDGATEPPAPPEQRT